MSVESVMGEQVGQNFTYRRSGFVSCDSCNNDNDDENDAIPYHAIVTTAIADDDASAEAATAARMRRMNMSGVNSTIDCSTRS